MGPKQTHAATRAGSRSRNPDLDQLADQPIFTPEASSETQEQEPRTPPATDQPIPPPRTVVKGKNTIRSQPPAPGSPSRGAPTSGGDQDDDQEFFGFDGPTSGRLGDDYDGQYHDRPDPDHPTYAQKLEIERLRTERLKLQLELAKLKAAPTQPTNQPTNPTPTPTPTLASDLVVQRMSIYDPDSAIGKQITVFLRQAKLVSEPIQLTGSSNYTAWKESILSRTKAVKYHYILEEKETAPPTQTDGKILWECVNDWLYDLMWNSISPQAKLQIETPRDRIAYNLWLKIRTKFQHPIEKQQCHIYRKLVFLIPKKCNSVREYLHKFQDFRMQLAKLNYPVADWQLIDILYGNITKVHRDFLQLKIESKRTSNFEAVDLDIDTVINEIISRLPKEDKDQSASGGNQGLHATEDKNKNKDKDKDKKGQNQGQNQSSNRGRGSGRGGRGGQSNRGNHASQNTNQPRCSYCGGWNHIDPDDCHYKNPEKATQEWRDKHQSLIDYFRKKDAEKKQLVLANPTPAPNSGSIRGLLAIEDCESHKTCTALPNTHEEAPIWDTGAGIHMTPSRSALDDYAAASSSITVVDNSKCNVEGIGDFTLSNIGAKIEN